MRRCSVDVNDLLIRNYPARAFVLSTLAMLSSQQLAISQLMAAYVVFRFSNCSGTPVSEQHEFSLMHEDQLFTLSQSLDVSVPRFSSDLLHVVTLSKVQPHP